MAQRFVVVSHIGGAFLRALLKAERAGADGYAIAILELMFIMWAAVNEHLVGTATEFAVNHGTVHESERAIIGSFDVRVITRSPRIIENYGVVWCTADGACAVWGERVFPLAATGVGNFQKCHDKRIEL